jgi:hypothetical protein
MFITKNITLPNGFVVSYWQITEIMADVAGGTASARVAGYKDQAAFETGLEKVGAWLVEFTLDPAHESVMPVLAMVSALVEAGIEAKVQG